MAELTDFQLRELYFCRRDRYGHPVPPKSRSAAAPARPRSLAEAKDTFVRAMMTLPGVGRAAAERAWKVKLAESRAGREGKAP